MSDAGADRLSGLAHVATCSFLASRIAPSAQFWIALGGGVALARAGARHGLRAGYGASLASVVQTVAMIGPLRVSGPLTQALNAPLVGWLQGRRSPFALVLAACLGIRLVHYAVLNVAFVLVVIGGLDEYVATYDKIAGFLRVLPEGEAWAIGLTIAMAIVWGLFYSVVQVLAYARALSRWPQDPPPAAAPAPAEDGLDEPAPWAEVTPEGPMRTHPWFVVVLALGAFAVLLSGTEWRVLGAVAAGLAVVWIGTRAYDWPAIRLGLILAALFAFGALGPAIVGAVPWADAGARAVRAALLVLVATWARAAAGADGVRRVARTMLRGLRLRHAARLTGELESDRRLGAAGRSLIDELRDVEKSPIPMADALTAWVAAESARHP